MSAIRGFTGLLHTGWTGAADTSAGRLVLKTMAVLVAATAALRVLGLG